MQILTRRSLLTAHFRRVGRRYLLAGASAAVLTGLLAPSLTRPLLWTALGLIGLRVVWPRAARRLRPPARRLVNSLPFARRRAIEPLSESDTCQRCEALLYRSADQQWLDFTNKISCWGRPHVPFGDPASSGAR